MRITNIRLLSANGVSFIDLSFDDPTSKNPYQIKHMEGLDAGDMSPKLVSGGARAFFDMVITRRDVVIRVGLNPRYNLNETFSSLRDDIYRFVASAPSAAIDILFMDDEDVIAQLRGFVTKTEGSHFSKSPEIQLTVVPIDKVLRSPDPVLYDVEGIDSEEFIVIDGDSTAPHGLSVTVEILANTLTYTFSGQNPEWDFIVGMPFGFLTGDVITISNDLNQKSIAMVRSGVTYQLADYILPGTVWPMMFYGVNQYSSQENTVVTELKYHKAYLGV